MCCSVLFRVFLCFSVFFCVFLCFSVIFCDSPQGLVKVLLGETPRIGPESHPLHFAQEADVAHGRTRDGRARAIASAIPGRHIFLVSRAFYFAQAIPGFLARAFYFAQVTYLAQMRTHDGGVRGIASAIPGRHPRGAHVDIVRLVIFLLGEITPASFAWPDGFRPGRQAHRVRRKLPWAARRAVFFCGGGSRAHARARAPLFLLCLNCVRSFPTLARAAPFFLW